MADVDAYLTRLETMLREARAVPMSASAMVHRDEALALLEEVRRNLPREMENAQRVLSERDAVIAEGREQAKAIIDGAYAERTELVSEHAVHRQAEVEAERIIHEAELETDRMRQEMDDYVDHKLANFEVVLHNTLEAVDKGRAKLKGRQTTDELGQAVDEDAVVQPLPGLGPEDHDRD